MTSVAAWRSWLRANHGTARAVWLVYFKKHTGKPALSYGEALDEALCVGWVDNLVRRIDEERAAWRFMPRKPGSTWSPSNVARFERLVRERRMTPAGRAHAPTAATRSAAVDNRAAGDLARVPRAIVAALKRNPSAWKNFQRMTAVQRGLYMRWILSAKKEETRDRRLTEAIARLARNHKPAMV